MNTGQTKETEYYSLEDEIANNPSMTYANGVFTLDGVSVDIPGEMVLTDVRNDEVRWSDGSSQRELRISKVETSASSSDLTQRKVVDSLTEDKAATSPYINYKGNSVLTCEERDYYEFLKVTAYKYSEWHNFYTAGSQSGSFVKLSFIYEFNGTLPQGSDEWPEATVSKIIDSLQSANEVTALYDIPKRGGSSTPSIATSELTCSYNAYWDDGRYIVEVQINNPSFLGYEGTVTVTCRDYHDKILDRKTNHVSCLVGTSWDGYGEQYPHFDSWDLLYNTKQLSGNQFAFSEDKVWTTPAKVEVTIE